MKMEQIPEGYMMNAEGALMPVDKVKPAHKLEDETVKRLIADAKTINEQLAKFKALAMGDAQAFRAMVAEQYGAKRGGSKGNMTLRSFDGSMSVQVQVSETIEFGPELHAAKELIDECISAWSEGSSDNIKVLVNDAFRVNKDRNIDTGRVLGLRRLEISDPKWTKAMDAIADAVRVTGSRSYIRFYEADNKGVLRAIPLDLASV